MKKSLFAKKIFVLAVFVHAGLVSYAQKTIEPDLSELFKSEKIKAFNRTASLVASGDGKTVIHLNEKDDSGIAWLSDFQFSEGTIEFDVKGRNVPQRSFVGIAFHGTSNGTYDAVYFRPFNFRSPEIERKNHSVQYISLPENDWPKLRKDHHNEYEKPVNPAPEPEEWIHARITVQDQEVKVYVNNNEEPSLVVKQLSNQQKGQLGFWVGAGSDGDFRNLKITTN